MQQFIIFKNKLCATLEINQVEDEVTDTDIVNEIDGLKHLIISLQDENQKLQSSEDVKSNKQIEEFMKLFGIGLEDNIPQKMNQIYMQFNDMQKFIRITKKILDLDEEMRSEAVLTYTIKLLEKMKLNKNQDIDLLLKLQKLLKADDICQILPRVEKM